MTFTPLDPALGLDLVVRIRRFDDHRDRHSRGEPMKRIEPQFSNADDGTVAEVSEYLSPGESAANSPGLIKALDRRLGLGDQRRDAYAIGRRNVRKFSFSP